MPRATSQAKAPPSNAAIAESLTALISLDVHTSEVGEAGAAAIARPGVASVQIILNPFRLKPLDEVVPTADAKGVAIIAGGRLVAEGAPCGFAVTPAPCAAGLTCATVFEADLFDFFGGACIGCPYRPNQTEGEAGFIRIVFDELDPTRATMTWGLDGGPQRTVPIERYHFYLKRPEDGSAPVEITKMLGEWNATFDLTEFTGNDTGIQYFGEVMVIDEFDFVDNGWFYYGCRPEHMVDGLCTTAARDSTELAGFYDAEFDVQIIIINDTFDQAGNPATCLYYDVRTGTNMFEGGLDDDFDGLDDGGVAIYPCPPGGNADPYDYDFFPVRGFRSASRTFVQEGTGPSKAKAQDAAPALKTRGLPVSSAVAPKVRDAAAEARIAKRLEIVRKLEARLGSR